MANPKYSDFLKKSRFNITKAKRYMALYNQIMELGLFDKDFYLSSYPNIKKSGMDPLIHYLFHGYREGKLPSLYFDIERYINEFPEAKNMNPLVHYVENNRKGFILRKDSSLIKKNRVIDTNSLFLNNYTFKEEPLVSIIILNRNGLTHLRRLFKDFDKKTNYDNYEIIVVDNASCDESVEYLNSLKKELPIKIIENSENVSFSKGNNDGAKIAKGEYLLLLNNDIEPTYGWLNEMVGTIVNKSDVGSVGAKLIFPYYSDMENQGKSFSIQHAGVKFREERTPYVYGPYHENMFLTLIFSDKVNFQKEVVSNTAACLLLSKKVYFELNGLDEDYFYGYEDIDFAFKLFDAGYKNIYCPSALLFHHESATRVDDERIHQLNFKNISTFVEKWGNFLFKNLLKDKINNNNFFTNKKLYFSIMNTHNSNKELVYSIAKSLNKEGYNVNLSSNINNLDLGEDCDIFISFNSDYNIKKVISRLNLIKILILDSLNKENIDYYDIVIVKNKSLINKINHKNVFFVESNKEIAFSKEILRIIEEVYLR